MKNIPPDTLQAIQKNFHKVILGRAEELVVEHQVPLPKLDSLLHSEASKGWFPIPGMAGGFSYWLELDGVNSKLITESWCRVVGGSGQRHEITSTGSRLLEAGFV